MHTDIYMYISIHICIALSLPLYVYRCISLSLSARIARCRSMYACLARRRYQYVYKWSVCMSLSACRGMCLSLLISFALPVSVIA